MNQRHKPKQQHRKKAIPRPKTGKSPKARRPKPGYRPPQSRTPARKHPAIRHPESEDVYRSIIDNMQDGFIRTDMEGNIILANFSALSLLGVDSLEEICLADMRKNFYADPEDKNRVWNALMDHGIFRNFETTLKRKDGSPMFVSSTARVVRDGKGKPIGIEGFFRDISERKRQEEETAKSGQWLQMVLDHFPGLVFVKDRNSVILGCNKYFAESAGKSNPSEVVGRTDFEMGWPKAETDRFRADDREVMESGNPKLGIIEPLTRQDGQFAWLETNKVPLKDSKGRVVGILGTAHDITEKVKAQELRIAKESAEAATKAKSRFLAHISHEIRNPMVAILGYSQLLDRDTSLTPQQKEYLGIVNQAGARLLELINDVLEMAKIETGRLELKNHPFHLLSVIKEVSELMRARTWEKKLEFRTEAASGLPRQVTGDEAKLRQIFLNLLSNAVKFTDKGRITWRIGTRREPGGSSGKIRLVCEVEDTGIGITPKDQEKLFHTFQRGDSPGAAGKEGTGLGLTISRHFARLMGGDITLKSEAGAGSCFKAEVVLEENEDLGAVSKPRESFPVVRIRAGQGPYRVLVADDKPDNLLLLRLMLERVGFQVRGASDGKEAVAVFGEWSPQLVFMDLGMPVMDGFEAARLIKSHQAGNQTVIVAVSASVFEEERNKLKEYGVEWFLPKPFREEELFQMIEKCLGVQFEYGPEDPGGPPKSEP